MTLLAAKDLKNRHLWFELSPGILFGILNFSYGFNLAVIGLLIASIAVSLLAIRLENRLPVFPFVTLLLVSVLGGLTLVFDDPVFIKIKPTLAKILFALILMTGLLLKPPLLYRAMHGIVYLTKKGWQLLTWRWTGAAIIFALVNELIWRNFETSFWVVYNSGFSPLSILVYIALTRFTARKYWDQQQYASMSSAD